ncbi:MAG: sugar-binding domain-containing protein, partial [Bacteroidales bacterium]
MKSLSLLPILLFLLCLAPVNGAEVQPLRKQLFNQDWKFFPGDAANASEAGFDDKSWRTLDLPHDWSIEGPIKADHPTGNDGGYFQAGVGWYRKSFEVPASWKEHKRVAIYFEGVYMNSELFINGKSLGVYPYGYSSFRYDLTPYLEYGKPNQIAVRVDNSQQPNCRWYSGSGIYRHVWLEVTPPVHIAPWGVAVATTTADSKSAVVSLKTIVMNSSPGMQEVTVRSFIRDKSETVVGSMESVIR